MSRSISDLRRQPVRRADAAGRLASLASAAGDVFGPVATSAIVLTLVIALRYVLLMPR